MSQPLIQFVLLSSMVALVLACAYVLSVALLSRLASPPRHASPDLLFRSTAASDQGAVGPVSRLRPSTSSRRYCLITPCRDEAVYARRTLEAVVHQTELPALWVIVDDGSQDSTPEILAEYAARYPFIRVLRRPDRGVRKLGGGVIDAFYTGYDTIDPSNFEYVCKFDLDLDLPPRYFELAMDWMEAYPRIGTCSGKPYFYPGGKPAPSVQFPLLDTAGLVSEKCGDENSVGMIKFYRTECFRQIGGFVRELMWDGIDGHRCREQGWIPVSSDHPQLRFVHLRPMGTSHKNWWTGRVRHGFGQYFMGTTPAYMIATALYRMTRPPVVLGGIAMLYGYFGAMAKRTARHGTPTFRKFLRSYQWSCLLSGKATATADWNARLSARWNPSNATMRHMGVGRPLGEILVQTSALPLDKLQEALAAQRGKQAGARLGEILVRMRAISEEEVQRAMALQFGPRAGASNRPHYLADHNASGLGA